MHIKYFIRENRVFFGGMALLLLVGLLWIAATPKGALIFWFSAHRSAWANAFFSLATKGGEWVGLMLVLLILLWFKFRWGLALLAMTPAVSLVANLAKGLFRQPRPGRYFRELGIWEQINTVPGIEVHQGLTSLPSGHTMAGFAFFGLLAFCLSNKHGAALAAFAAACTVGLSRIYLVQHFEEDVLLGAVLGVLLAALFHHLFQPAKAAAPGRIDRGLRNILFPPRA